ncbi:hypothetical protein BGX24_002955 [Mortierella sp. AD032]|nr:hypothetical protein BGX24_002955 [Mortierella sp. AD032]
MRLDTPDRAKQFYSMLQSTILSTRLIHELNLTLDWSASSEDLRALRDVDTILQIMASEKIHSMGLMNVIGFLSQTKEFPKATFHFRHFDLGERVENDDDFLKLVKLIHASPWLIRLGVVVDDMDGAFARLKPIVGRHKTLSILDLHLQDGTAASVKFEQGSENVSTIGLKVLEPSAIRLMSMPMVTSVAFLAKNTLPQSSSLIKSALKEHVALKVIEVVYLPDGESAVLHKMQQAIHDYCSGCSSEENSAQDEISSATTVNSPELIEASSKFMELETLHRQSVLLGMELMVALTEEADPESLSTDEMSGEALGKSEAAVTDRRGTISVFTSRRQDGSLAMVRLDPNQNGSNSAVLHVGDFDMSEVHHHSSAARLMLVGQQGATLFNEMIKAPSSMGGFRNLKTVEFDCKPRDILSFLEVVQLARTRCPALTKLHLWNASHEAMEDFGVSSGRTLVTYDIIHRKMDFGDYFVSPEEISSLQKVFRGSPLISELTITVRTSAVNNSLLAEGEKEVFVKRQNGAAIGDATKRNVMQWMMSTSTSVTLESVCASSVYSEEKTDVHFQCVLEED